MKIEEALGYVSQLFTNISGFIYLDWEFKGNDDVVIFNTDESEGSPADDNWEAAELVGKLTGWEPYEITNYDDYDQYSGEPFYVGLKRK